MPRLNEEVPNIGQDEEYDFVQVFKNGIDNRRLGGKRVKNSTDATEIDDGASSIFFDCENEATGPQVKKVEESRELGEMCSKVIVKENISILPENEAGPPIRDGPGPDAEPRDNHPQHAGQDDFPIDADPDENDPDPPAPVGPPDLGPRQRRPQENVPDQPPPQPINNGDNPQLRGAPRNEPNQPPPPPPPPPDNGPDPPRGPGNGRQPQEQQPHVPLRLRPVVWMVEIRYATTITSICWITLLFVIVLCCSAARKYEVDELSKRHETEMRCAREQSETEFSAAEVNYQLKMENRERWHQRQLQKKDEEHGLNVDKIRKEHGAELNRKNTEIQDCEGRFGKVSSELNESRKESAARLQEVGELKTKMRIAMETHEAKLRVGEENHRSELKNQHRLIVGKLRAEHHAELHRKNAVIQGLQNTLNQATSKFKKFENEKKEEVTMMQKQVDELRFSLKEAKKLQSDAKEKMDEMEIRLQEEERKRLRSEERLRRTEAQERMPEQRGGIRIRISETGIGIGMAFF